MTKENSSLKIWLIAIVVFISLFAIWCFFPLFFQWLIVGQFKIDPKSYGETFGAVGDTYGSLNTFVSSVALCAVAFSTWVQVTSLRETREANKCQLNLAEAAHDEQIKESREAVFANKFYSLLNYKKDKLNNIELTLLNKEKVKAYVVIIKLANIFTELSSENSEYVSCNTSKELRDNFHRIGSKICIDSMSSIISYYYAYIDLINLIKNAKIPDEDKEFYKSVLRNSMFHEEQILLFWIAPMFSYFRGILFESEIFNMFSPQNYYHEYALKHHDISNFKNDEWKIIFIEKTKTPA